MKQAGVLVIFSTASLHWEKQTNKHKKTINGWREKIEYENGENSAQVIIKTIAEEIKKDKNVNT